MWLGIAFGLEFLSIPNTYRKNVLGLRGRLGENGMKDRKMVEI